MNLYINGYRTTNKNLVQELTNAAYYYGMKLIGYRMLKNITLDITLVKDMFKKERAYGYCSIVGDVNKPREFEIELDASTDHSVANLLTWLAHEFVHLKQFVKGELQDYEDGSVGWKSKTYRDGTDYSADTYPWEKEAYKNEDKLYYEYLANK